MSAIARRNTPGRSYYQPPLYWRMCRPRPQRLAMKINPVSGSTCTSLLCGSDLPPLKWSFLKYVFRMEDKIDGKEEAYG